MVHRRGVGAGRKRPDPLRVPGEQSHHLDRSWSCRMAHHGLGVQTTVSSPAGRCFIRNAGRPSGLFFETVLAGTQSVRHRRGYRRGPVQPSSRFLRSAFPPGDSHRDPRRPDRRGGVIRDRGFGPGQVMWGGAVDPRAPLVEVGDHRPAAVLILTSMWSRLQPVAP